MEEKQKERQMTGFDFRKEAEGLLDFIDKSPTVFHTVANAAAMLVAAWLFVVLRRAGIGSFRQEKNTM